MQRIKEIQEVMENIRLAIICFKNNKITPSIWFCPIVWIFFCSTFNLRFRRVKKNFLIKLQFQNLNFAIVSCFFLISSSKTIIFKIKEQQANLHVILNTKWKNDKRMSSKFQCKIGYNWLNVGSDCFSGIPDFRTQMRLRLSLTNFCEYGMYLQDVLKF